MWTEKDDNLENGFFFEACSQCGCRYGRGDQEFLGPEICYECEDRHLHEDYVAIEIVEEAPLMVPPKEHAKLKTWNK